MSIVNYKKLLFAGALSIIALGNAQAQEDEFDLSSQRSEVQDVLPVPGHKLDHKGIVINPTPQVFTYSWDNTLQFNDGLVIKDKQKKFTQELSFVKQVKKGTKLTIDFGAKAAKKYGVKEVSGAYILNIDKKGITIVGYDERGAFYGIETLKQLLENKVSIP